MHGADGSGKDCSSRKMSVVLVVFERLEVCWKLLVMADAGGRWRHVPGAATSYCHHHHLAPSCLNTGTMGRGELLLVPGPHAAALSLSHMLLMEY